MALTMPKGSQFGFAPIIKGSNAKITAIANAKPGTVTYDQGATQPPDDAVILVKASGWPLLNNKVCRLGPNDELLGIDTSDTDLFPAAGFGIAETLTAGEFVDFTQQGDPSTSGGEQQFWTGQLLEDPLGRQISMPTFKNAKTMTIPLYYDPSEPWYDAAKKIDIKGEAVVLRNKLANGDVLYYYGYLSFDGDPSIQSNTPMGNTATFTIIGESTLVRKA
ncbi:tail protein [Stenotrophomonas phage BUCT603]|nr:tail protein [Stenotrophomonas phage BUCT603]